MMWFGIALLSSFLSAFAAIAQKKVLFQRSPLEFSFLLAIVNLLFSLPFFLFINYVTITPQTVVLLFVKSVIGVAAFLCVMTALKNLQISNALQLLALTPGFVAVFAFLILGESLTTSEAAGLLALILGTYILESKNLKEIFFPLNVFLKSTYHRYIIAALFLFTAASILDKLLIVKMQLTPLALTAFQHFFFAVLFSALYLFARRREVPKTGIPFKGDMLWIVLISVLTIGYRYTQVVSISMASVALTLAVKRTSVLWATVIGGKIFKDTNLIKKIIAVLFIVAGALLILRD
jgi:drug/metabolite transporter (DMT)-like permease